MGGALRRPFCCPSWPGATRPSTTTSKVVAVSVDARDKRGHDKAILFRVIASEAKQSKTLCMHLAGLLRRFAPRNDGAGT
jgi:error-prone DNA polymerase